MAALVEGHQYGLSSENSTSGHKSVIHVKLTDSALKALEGFQKIKGSHDQRPSIQFQGSEGVIKVPVPKSTDNPEGLTTFRFSLSAIPVDPKGSFECIKQSCNGEQELDLLGAMLHKVSIRATDDSYGNTRERMNQAVEDSKKQRAKEIKPNGPGLGRRIKKVIRNPVLPSQSISQRSSLGSALPQSFKPTTPSIPRAPVRDEPQHVSPVPRPTCLPIQKSGLSTNHNTANRPPSGVVNMPLRDRIIHLLALRPYKKPELMIRLQKDGLKEKDKNTLGSVLNQVGQFNPRDNNFSLARHLYPEVQANWQYYSETDRQLLKRKMNQLTEPALATTSPAVSPCHSTGSQGSPNSSQKRMICDEKMADDQPPKKQRVTRASLSESAESVVKSNSVSTGNKTNSSLNPVSPESPGNQENNILMEAVSLDDKPDYLRKFQKIQDPDQRLKYKSEFNTEYDEYRRLHSLIEGVTKKFLTLRDELNKQSKDTVDYKNIRKRIMCEYKLVKEDTKYLYQRRRHDYLHQKLGHIKKLISDFDNERLALS